jgi:hypothetical protein
MSDYPALDPRDNECRIVVPTGITLIVERVTVAIEVPALADVQQLIVRL